MYGLPLVGKSSFLIPIVATKCATTESGVFMPMYRCTKPLDYPPGSAGYSDNSAREAHFVVALDSKDARKEMRKKFPLHVLFEVEEWDLSDTMRKIRIRAS